MLGKTRFGSRPIPRSIAAVADVLLTSALHSNALAAGAGYTASDTVTLPPSMAAGSYFFIVVTDSGDTVAEISTSNNQTSAASATSVSLGPVPELAVSNVTLAGHRQRRPVAAA